MNECGLAGPNSKWFAFECVMRTRIVVNVDKPEDRPAALKAANRLLEQLRRGATFPVVARQFSEGTTAANGGDIGWMQLGQLSSELAKEVQSMTPGEVSAPVFSDGSYHILLLQEVREILGPDKTLTELHLKQIFINLPEGASDQRCPTQHPPRLQERYQNLQAEQEVSLLGEPCPLLHDRVPTPGG